jgi:3-keto-5-aminohexanoate cleavage enzyme
MLPEGAVPEPRRAAPSGSVPLGGRARSDQGAVVSCNFVMGVASGMPCDADLLDLLPRWLPQGAVWQATLIGRAEVWPVHQRTAELGGMLRTGLEDTFYLPDGTRAAGNGALIQQLAACAERCGRAIASPDEARTMLALHQGATA